MMFPMWGAAPPAAMPLPPSEDLAAAPNTPPFLPPPNRGWKRKAAATAYRPPTLGDLQVQNRAKARRWFKSSNPNPNNPRKYFPKNRNMVVVVAAIGGTRQNRGDGEGERRIRQKISYPWTAPGGAGGTERLQRRALVASAHPAGRGDGDQRRH
jgi:hypothetical protein